MKVATLGMTEAERDAIARFQADVVEPSQTSLVILDFWAQWCGPCKQVAPILDKIAAEFADRNVRLVKIDVDEDKWIAAQFRIQSIPTIYAFFQGQPVADITNYRTEGQMRQAIEHLLAQLPIAAAEPASAEIGPLVAMGEEVLESGDAARAISIFSQVRDMAPDDPDVIGGLARAFLAGGEAEQAREVLDQSGVGDGDHPAIARARAAIALSGEQKDDTEIAALRSAAERDPDDHAARIALADALAAGGNRDEAADILLASIARDKEWDEGTARRKFLQILEAQGIADPWTKAQRRRLSAVLFT